ncbi:MULTISPECIES: hypothetical protein [unclassified Nocardia]|uniref:TPR repeat region-containing protein n=1 Tax=unclassified Nocardia TaxID=2637762 RepID=UPI001CE4B2F8|nr:MULTISPECIES: hypothetical protein [unclassified Nocardia]
MPTRKEVETWRTSALSDWATTIETDDSAYAEQLDRARNQIKNLDGQWVGKVHDAAYNRIGEEHDEGRKLSFQIRELTAVLRNGDTRLSDERRILLGTITETEAASYQGATFTVSDKWEVSAHYPDNVTDDQRTKIQNMAWLRQQQVNTNYYALVGAINEVIQNITAKKDAIHTRGDQLGSGIEAQGPAGWASERAVSGKDGEADGKAIASGHLTPEQKALLDQHLAALGVTSDMLGKLQRGEDVTIPQSTLDYLTALEKESGRDGLLDVSRQLSADGSPDAKNTRSALAGAMLLASNEHVQGVDNNGRKTGDHGSWDKLNPAIREIIGTRPDFGGAPDSNTRSVPEGYRHGRGAAWPFEDTKRYQSDLGELAGFVHNAPDSYQPGTRFGVEMDRQAAHQAWILEHHDDRLTPGSNSYLESSKLEQTAQDLLGAGSRNHESSYAILTGKDVPGLDLFGKDTPGQSNHYHRDEIVAPLLEHGWKDQGKAASGLFSWMKDDAVVTDPGNPVSVDRATRAGEAAYGLSQLLSTTHSGANGENLYSSFMNHNGQSLGQLNPLIAQGMASGLAPYVGNMVGAPSELTGTLGYGNLPPVEATRLFSVLDTDPKAGTILNASALAEATKYDKQWAAQEASGINLGHDSLGNFSGRLHALVDEGISAESASRYHDASDAQAEALTRKTAVVNAVQAALSATATVPVPGVPATVSALSGGAVNVVGYLIQPDILNSGGQLTHDLDPASRGVDFSNTGQPSTIKYSMVQQLVDQGRLDINTLPYEFIRDGANGKVIAPYSQVTDMYGDTRIGDLADKALHQSGVARFSSYEAAHDTGANKLYNILKGTAGTNWSIDQAYSNILLVDTPRGVANKW